VNLLKISTWCISFFFKTVKAL